MIVIPVAIGQARLAQIHLGRVVEIVVDHALDVRIRHAAVVAVEIFAEFKIIVAVAPQVVVREIDQHLIRRERGDFPNAHFREIAQEQV